MFGSLNLSSRVYPDVQQITAAVLRSCGFIAFRHLYFLRSHADGRDLSRICTEHHQHLLDHVGSPLSEREVQGTTAAFIAVAFDPKPHVRMRLKKSCVSLYKILVLRRDRV